jgi:hypothetical protein
MKAGASVASDATGLQREGRGSEAVDAPTPRGPGARGGAEGGGAPPLWATLAAALVFLGGVASVQWEVWSQGFGTALGYTSRRLDGTSQQGRHLLERNDAVFTAALVARSARVLTHEPRRLFDAEHCAPAERTLTYGDPMLTMALLGVPFQRALDDPIASFNGVVALLPWLGAMAMYLLVWDWTRVPAAGVVAGLLYAFERHRLWDASHPFLYDTAWTVLGLFFARRLLAGGRGRDAVGLGASLALQLGAGLYPVIGAVLLAPPLAAWLLASHGLRRAGAARLALAAGVVLAAAAWLYTPYLATRAASPAPGSVYQAFAELGSYLPGGRHFPGWLCLCLVGVALGPGAGRATPGMRASPRWALLAGTACVAWGAAGPTLAPGLDLYAALARVLPGLDAVRAPDRAATVVHLALCVLAGLGVAHLLRRLPRRAAAGVAGLLVGAALFASLASASPWWGETRAFDVVRARPRAQELALFAELERSGNRGPLLELPVDSTRQLSMRDAPARILLSAYHHRRTSACYGALRPERRDELADLAAALPGPRAVDGVRDLGFTTLVLHHLKRVTPRGAVQRARLEAEARREDGRVRHLGGTDAMDVYALLP